MRSLPLIEDDARCPFLCNGGTPLLPPAPGLSTYPDGYALLIARPGVLLRFDDNNVL